MFKRDEFRFILKVGVAKFKAVSTLKYRNIGHRNFTI